MIRVARPFSRRRWVSITVSASTCARSRNSHQLTAFSNRDRVGCEARAGPAMRIAIHEQFVDRVVGHPGGVVAVGVATGDAKHALPEQLERLVLDLARLAPVDQARGHALGQLQLGIEALQQHRPAVRAGVRHVEAGDDRLALGSNPNVTCAIQSVAIEPPHGCA